MSSRIRKPAPWLWLSTAALFALGLAAGPAEGAATVEVTIKQTQVGFSKVWTFDPPAVQIKPGTTVVWTNPTAVLHRVATTTGTTGDFFDENLEGFGECENPPGTPVPCSFSYTFEVGGVLSYQCATHLTSQPMHGAISVGSA